MKTCLQLRVMKECSCYIARLPFGSNITAYDSVDIDGLLPCDDQSLSESKRGKLHEHNTNLTIYEAV